MNLSSEKINKLSVCLIHDWLVAMRGGEKVLEAMSELFPEAPIYTLFFDRTKLSTQLQKKEIHASFLQFFPRVSKYYRWLLPLFPIAIRFLNIKQFDLVISSSHCVAKAVRVRKGAVHICYCHTPMRYLWGFSEDYFGRFPKWLRRLLETYFKWLRLWDVRTSKQVRFFIANSQNTAHKIKQLYDKSAHVIYPPVELSNSASQSSGDYFLIVSALVPYKRVDLAIQAFNQLRQPLKIVGDGPLRAKLKSMIQFDGIQLDGWIDSDTLRDCYGRCRALIFPGEEDFGIVPIEAQSYGKPVIAFGKGGVMESVTSETGVFFYEQKPEALIQAVQEFESLRFNPKTIKQHAQSFNAGRFKSELLKFMENLSATARSQQAPFS